ncbi:MAG: Glu-tRNA(Gln) amidotransferase subunit GatD [Nanoarchaeota archaeon]|nr:Glu-tRNA(Gln) amidotransferase subunit GatD [Nanoarchaeota archaeon]
MANPGDKVQIIYDDKAVEGILMPDSADSLFLKLESGYNIGISKEKVKEIKVVEARKDTKKGKSDIPEKKGLKKIIVLHTGGTIASKVDYSTGGVIAQFTAKDLVDMVPEIKDIANIKCELVANMMSEDMMFSDHQKIAAAVKRNAEKGADGIIIGHGTDTLTYTAASLAFMFERIDIPVLIVGSQRSSDRPSTDAAMNLICAARFIAETGFKGIAVCMHHHSSDDKCAILPATKTRKMHTSRRDAFRAINTEPIAFIDFKLGKIDFLNKPSDMTKGILLKDRFENNVGLLKTHPNMDPELFAFYTKNYKGFVIEGTGLGHAPTNLGEDNLKNHKILKDFIAKGGIVAVTSQCINGRVHPDVYTNLRRLSNIGCIFLEDMLPETAFIKLAWLLGNYSPEETKKLLAENLRGEITERTEYEEEFI